MCRGWLSDTPATYLGAPSGAPFHFRGTMRQVAVFVDAGYLYAQGSALLAGSRQKRPQVRLRVDPALTGLKELAAGSASDARLLRIYWYDGLPRNGRLSAEQSAIANAADVKVRLGLVNGQGEQKGVDSLIVTDMIDLARNRAISDAVILSGDEDIRVGVQVAQTFGVRVHLIGIEPARGSQSPDLLREADTCHEVDHDTMLNWMEVTPPAFANEVIAMDEDEAMEAPTSGPDAVFAKVVTDVVSSLSAEELQRCRDHIAANRNTIPPEIDRPCLARVGSMLRRDLDEDERRSLRQRLREALRAAPPQ